MNKQYQQLDQDEKYYSLNIKYMKSFDEVLFFIWS
jgi:hypothetical protein